MHDFLARSHLSDATIATLINIGIAVVILLIGIWLAARVANIAQRAMQRGNVDVTLSGFLRNLIYGVLIALLIVMALQQAGVPSAPLVAALGAGGLAIGLALQGSLSNLAWGVPRQILRQRLRPQEGKEPGPQRPACPGCRAARPLRCSG